MPPADAFTEAVDAYPRALELDAAHPPEGIRRFQVRKEEAIRATLEACLDQPPQPRNTPQSPGSRTCIRA